MIADALERARNDADVSLGDAVDAPLPLECAERAIRSTFERELAPLDDHLRRLERTLAVRYRGIDTSVNPAIDQRRTLVDCFALVGGARRPFGGNGTLATCEMLTRAIDGRRLAALRTCGYCGLMLPVCEDGGLAAATERPTRVSVTSLLAYSAVCGIGLDTTPLPGDASVAQLAAIFADVHALSRKWSKPLTARLFPVPGVALGERTDFRHPYLCDAFVLDPE